MNSSIPKWYTVALDPTKTVAPFVIAIACRIKGNQSKHTQLIILSRINEPNIFIFLFQIDRKNAPIFTIWLPRQPIAEGENKRWLLERIVLRMFHGMPLKQIDQLLIRTVNVMANFMNIVIWMRWYYYIGIFIL